MARSDPTLLDFALLGLLCGQSMSGYDIRKLFETTPIGRFSSSQGSIYPALQRLERGTLVKGTVQRATTLRPRKLYRLTAAGRAALVAWMKRPSEPRDVERRLDELCLRFAFMEHLLPRADRVAFTEQLCRALRTHVQYLEQHYRNVRGSMALHARLSLELGVEAYKVQLRWAERAAEAIRAESQ
jgi:DNA-binding PadR family transcriptional regulator